MIFFVMIPGRPSRGIPLSIFLIKPIKVSTRDIGRASRSRRVHLTATLKILKTLERNSAPSDAVSNAAPRSSSVSIPCLSSDESFVRNGPKAIGLEERDTRRFFQIVLGHSGVGEKRRFS